MSDLSESGLHRIIEGKAGRWYLHWTTAFASIVVGLSCVLFTGLPLLGRVAWANETDVKIDNKIALAIQPLVAVQETLTKTQSAQQTILYRLATASLRADICRYAARRILERDLAERSRLLDQINTMRDQYKLYSGREFDPADC